MATLVCLHGWGGSKESFTELRAALKDVDITLITPDLPGFGKEPEPATPLDNAGYADWVIEHCLQNIEEDWYLLGHSHGGRISIKLLTEQLQKHGTPLPKQVFLCAAAGIKRPRHFRRIIGLTLAKTGKAILSLPGFKQLQPLGKKLLYKLVRVHDYEKASEVMRKTLINVSSEDLRPMLQKITVPTDLFWGTEDGMTPYSDALVMEREIPSVVLHSYSGVRHRVHRDRATEIASVIRQRLER